MARQLRSALALPFIAVALVRADPPAPGSELDVLEKKNWCLAYVGSGCQSIRDEVSCVNSRDGSVDEELDGRGVRGQRCMWCGGGACTGGGRAVCGAENWTLYHPQFLAHDRHSVRTCERGQRLKDTVGKLNEEQSEELAVSQDDRGAFVVIDGSGRTCRGLHAFDRGGAFAEHAAGQSWSFAIWSALTLEECEGRCEAGCIAVSFSSSSSWCEAWYDQVTTTKWQPGFTCRRKRQECLVEPKEGCASLTSEADCLRSKERETTGQTERDMPCVFCSGRRCGVYVDAVCMPLDELSSLRDSDLATLKDMNPEVATCDGGSPSSASLRVVPRPPPLPKDEFLDPGMHLRGYPQSDMRAKETGTGRFITGGREVFWQVTGSSEINMVPPTVDCETCGCAGQIESVSSASISQLRLGADFDCRITPPTAQVMYLNNGTPELEPVPWWIWLLLTFAILACVLACVYGSYAAMTAMKKGSTRAVR